SRMLFSPQEMMLRRKLEQEAELQHAIELQGIPYSSPRQSRLLMNQHVTTSSDSINQEESEDACQEAVDEKFVTERTESFANNRANADDSDLEESLEHILPDNLFASPTKSAAEHHTVFSQTSASADDSTPVTIKSSNNTTPGPPGSSPLGMASLKSCYIQMPRYYNAAFTCYALLCYTSRT
ncbi:UNVERIFIED_CONTAM: hypothetical protein Scaly_1946900, partial [Sesamum calycinum]